ncbi:hypothetical protein [Gordonia sp. (in: high G+C Gram-positive bacteria)]|uniref:hypothetical protein n=1 Tax=Gordonia sp. (in: high G+C Gram-positive bacteria) TaxID=84139 RepID=UPI003C742E18
MTNTADPTDLADVTLLEVTVDTGEFRRALAAVTVHAAKDADRSHLHRIRCHIGPGLMFVTAADGYTAAAARVQIIAADGTAAADVGHVDLSPADVGKILAVFHVGKRSDREDIEMLLRIKVAVALHPAEEDGAPLVPAPYVHLTDVSGMIPGEALELPVLPADDHAPDVPRLLSRIIAAPAGVLDTFGLTPELIGRFTRAAKAYSTELLISATYGGARPMLVVRAGQNFVGSVSPLSYPEDQQDKHRSWLEQWLDQLPPPLADPGPAPTPGAEAPE